MFRNRVSIALGDTGLKECKKNGASIDELYPFVIHRHTVDGLP